MFTIDYIYFLHLIFIQRIFTTFFHTRVWLAGWLAG
jgi:hypothetical protein